MHDLGRLTPAALAALEAALAMWPECCRAVPGSAKADISTHTAAFIHSAVPAQTHVAGQRDIQLRTGYFSPLVNILIQDQQVGIL